MSHEHSDNSPNLSPEQLEALEISAQTQNMLESVTYLSMPGTDETPNDFFEQAMQAWSLGSLERYLLRGEKELRVHVIGEFEPESAENPTKTLSEMVSNLPAEYGNLTVLKRGLVDVHDADEIPLKVAIRYSFYEVVGAAMPQTVIVRQHVDHYAEGFITGSRERGDKSILSTEEARQLTALLQEAEEHGMTESKIGPPPVKLEGYPGDL